jgi:Cu/Ag efflux protein CusF
MQATQERVMTKGVITRLDEASGKVGLKVGDVVSFLVENRAGKLTVTQLQKR